MEINGSPPCTMCSGKWKPQTYFLGCWSQDSAALSSVQENVIWSREASFRWAALQGAWRGCGSNQLMASSGKCISLTLLASHSRESQKQIPVFFSIAAQFFCESLYLFFFFLYPGGRKKFFLRFSTEKSQNIALIPFLLDSADTGGSFVKVGDLLRCVSTSPSNLVSQLHSWSH